MINPSPETSMKHNGIRGICNDCLEIKRLERKRQVLLISGDYSTPVGSLTCAMDVCQSGVLQRHSITHVDIAGHPEGSKNVPSPFEAVSQKVFSDQFVSHMDQPVCRAGCCQYIGINVSLGD